MAQLKLCLAWPLLASPDLSAACPWPAYPIPGLSLLAPLWFSRVVLTVMISVINVEQCHRP